MKNESEIDVESRVEVESEMGVVLLRFESEIESEIVV